MVPFTRPPECSLVGIIMPVTGVAVRRGAHLHSIGFLMARMALEVVVSTRQRIARLLIMIKAPTRPTAWAMAGPAIGSKSTGPRARMR